jgi:putative phosphoesterase
MKIGLIGDIHANLPALIAVHDHLQRWNIEKIWNIGDFVGYGPYPNQVIDFCRRKRYVSVSGNYDHKVLHFEEKERKWARKKIPEKMVSFRWAAEQLSPENRAYLAELPDQREFLIEGWHILLIHSSPADPKEHLCPATPLARLEEISRQFPYDLIICGHSHEPFIRKAGKTWFINTGSVGRPDDGDPRATYAYLELRLGALWACHLRVAYPVAETVAEIRRQELPEDYAQMLLHGRNLESILAEK